MIALNSLEKNGNADKILKLFHKLIPQIFLMGAILAERLIGVEMGVAYGGGLAELGRAWKGIGQVYGFDTYEGHPTFLADSPDNFEARCMDIEYGNFGKDTLSYEYIRGELDKEGLTNVHLIKGLIDGQSCKDIPYIHYAFIDLDILESMMAAYEAVKDKIVPGGFLCLHDVYGIHAFPRLGKWYQIVVRTDNMWEVIFEEDKEVLAILRRK